MDIIAGTIGAFALVAIVGLLALAALHLEPDRREIDPRRWLDYGSTNPAR